MLLDEDRRDADEHAQRDHDPLQMPLAQPRRLTAGRDEAHAADDVHARADVGIRVGGIDAADHPGKDVVPRELGGAEILPVREDPADNDRRNESCQHEPHIFSERLHVVECQIDRHQKQQRMPHAIGHDKIFAERDLVVQREVGDPVVGHNGMLYNNIKDQIEDPE